MKWLSVRAYFQIKWVMLLLFSSAAMALSPIEQAEELYFDDQFDAAVTMLKPIAKKGNLEAVILLAEMYIDGAPDVPMNAEKALYWYSYAIQLGDPDAQDGVKWIEEQLKKTDELVVQSNARDPESMYLLSRQLMDGSWITQDKERAFDLLKAAALEQHPKAQLALGHHYDRIGQKTLALDWFEHAASNGNLDAHSELATRYWIGNGVKADPARSVEHHKQLCVEREDEFHEQKIVYSTFSCTAVADYYRNGVYTKPNDRKALQWLILAANQDDADALEDLGEIYAHQYSGLIVEKYPINDNNLVKNVPRAYQFLALAAAKNRTASMHLLYKLTSEEPSVKAPVKSYAWLLVFLQASAEYQDYMEDAIIDFKRTLTPNEQAQSRQIADEFINEYNIRI